MDLDDRIEFRISTELKIEAQKKAEDHDLSLGEVIRELLLIWLDES